MATRMREKLNFSIMQNQEIYKSIVQSKTYDEFIKKSGNEKVHGYTNAKFKEKRFKDTLTDLVKNY